MVVLNQAANEAISSPSLATWPSLHHYLPSSSQFDQFCFHSFFHFGLDYPIPLSFYLLFIILIFQSDQASLVVFPDFDCQTSWL